MIALTPDDKQHGDKDRCIAFQADILVTDTSAANKEMRPRTLEEAIVYENFSLLRSGALSIGISIPEDLNDVYEAVYNHIRSDNFKKTDFAMDILASVDKWVVPRYIADGLRWLESRLTPLAPTARETDAPIVLESTHG